VQPASWKALKEAGRGVSQWKTNNPGKKIDDAPF
jgi:hypothetical protein